jgi:hypothetical protein
MTLMLFASALIVQVKADHLRQERKMAQFLSKAAE